MNDAPLLPRSLTSKHNTRRIQQRAQSAARARRRKERRVEFEARQLIVKERIAKLRHTKPNLTAQDVMDH